MQKEFGAFLNEPLPGRPGSSPDRIDFPPPHSDAGRCHLRFSSAGEANSLSGGVALVARVARAAFDDGCRILVIGVADRRPLAASAIDDLNRACPDARIRYDNSCPLPPRPWVTPDVRAIVRQTAKSGDGLISRYVNRPLSQAITRRLLAHVPAARPMHVTLVVGVLGLLMIALMLSGSWAGFVAGALLFQLCSLLDGVDGELARATWRCTPAGARADTLTDQAINLGFFAGFAAGAERFYGESAGLAAELVMVIVPVGVGIMLLLAWLRGNMGSMNFLKTYYRGKFPGGVAGSITNILIFMTSRDFFAFTGALLVVTGLGLAVPFILLGFAILWLVLILFAFLPVLRSARVSAVASGS